MELQRSEVTTVIAPEPAASRADEQLEAARMLADHARNKFGELPVAPIVALALRAAEGADYSVASAALDALARRFAFAVRDELRVIVRPKRDEVVYRVGRRRRDARSYEVWLRSVDPIELSCSCADYVRSGLGLCKHGMVVLAATHGKRGKPTRSAPAGPTLRWDASQPLGLEPEGGVAPARARLFDRAARLTLDGRVPRLDMPHGRPSHDALASPEKRAALLRALTRAVEAGRLWADPAAGRIVHEELARATRIAEARRGTPAARASLRGLLRKLYPYQQEGVERLLETGRLLLADDMGLGKTTQAVACCHALLASKVVRRVLLVVPAALKPQWAREWSSVTGLPVTVVSGSPAERAELYASADRGALIMGYEQLLRDLPLVTAWLPELVVLDEAQRIKNWETKSAAAVKSLSPRYRLVLTGTPMENRLAELASIVDFVDDVALEPKWRLTPLHTFSEGDADRGASGARHLGILRARLAPIMLRRVRQEVIAQLPERTDTRVPVELTEPQRDEHEALEQPISAILRQAEKRPLRQEEFVRLMQLMAMQRMICNGLAQLRFDVEWERCQGRRPTEALLGSLFTPKLAAFRALIEELALAQGRKVVVFSQWRKMLRLAAWSIGDVLGDAGMRAMFFTGAESSALRERALVDFHDDPSVPVLFLTDAGGVGLNLQRAATACIQLELPWNPAVMEQRIGRIHRLGQSHPIDVYHLVTEEGIEARIANLLGHKRALFTSLFDGTTDTVHFDRSSSFLSTVREIYAQDAGLGEGAFEDQEAFEDEALDDLGDDGPELVVEDGVVVERTEPGPAPAPTPLLELPSEPAPSEPGSSEPGSSEPGSSEPSSSEPGSSEPAAPFRVTPRPDGGLSIDVPPGLAEPLAGLLASLAQALRGDSPPS